jgi:hypothetical protein
MNLHLQPKQFLVLYNCIKKYENDVYYDDEEAEIFKSVKVSLEEAIISAFERLESQTTATYFDKWVKSEKNKIQGLEKELEKIKETVPTQELLTKFQPVKPDRQKGRPKKRS